MAHSVATPSLVAHIMYQKFALGTPFHNHKEVLDDLLPWSKELPSECSLKQIKNKCLK